MMKTKKFKKIQKILEKEKVNLEEDKINIK